MILRRTLLVVALGLAGCGGSDGSLFNGSGNKGSPDAATSGGASSSSGGQPTGGAGAGGSLSTGGNAAASSGGRGNSPDGSAGTSGAAADGAAGAPADASKGGASGKGGTPATGGKGGASTGGKGGTAGDAGAPVGVATPLSISCGTSTCTITSGLTNVCCALPFAFPPFPTGCFPEFPGCVTTGVPFACDDAADCTNGNICCGSTGGTACAKTCSTGKVQFCRTNDECKSGACRPWSVTKEYSTCQ